MSTSSADQGGRAQGLDDHASGEAPIGALHAPWSDRLIPRAGVRTQLTAAALTWLLAASMLLVRGVLFAAVPGQPHRAAPWLLPVIAAAVLLGLFKARRVLVPYARRAVDRIRLRGTACLFGFFAPASWAAVVAMMGTGIALRHSALAQVTWGRAVLCLVYLAVGTALIVADRVFIVAAWGHRAPATTAPDPLASPAG